MDGEPYEHLSSLHAGPRRTEMEARAEVEMRSALKRKLPEPSGGDRWTVERFKEPADMVKDTERLLIAAIATSGVAEAFTQNKFLKLAFKNLGFDIPGIKPIRISRAMEARAREQKGR